VIRTDGSGLRRLSETGGWPVWWPDGKQVGYQNLGEDGSEEICTVSFTGGLYKPLRSLQFNGTNNPFDVSPDGALIATSQSELLSSDIWLLAPKR
jgi:Tol biopolymer transport system component